MTEELKPKVESGDQEQGKTSKARRWRRGAGGRNPRSVEPKFEGKSGETELKGHIFDCSDGLGKDVYANTLKETAEYVGRKYDHGADILATLENGARYDPPTPVDLTGEPRATAKRIWEKEVE